MTRTKILLLCGVAIAFATTESAAAQFWRVRHGPDFYVSYSRDTGGYCDNAGCPDHFWTYPIFYRPVLVRGAWYRGPVYTRDDPSGRHWFWIRGDWRRDEWHGPRPFWARNVHFGPPMDFAFYESHGFNVGGRWHYEHDAWMRNHPQGFNDNGRGYYSQGGYNNGPPYDQGYRNQGGYDQGYRQGPPPDQRYGQNGPPPPNGYDYGRADQGRYAGWRGGPPGNQQTAQNNGPPGPGNPNNPPAGGQTTASNGPPPSQITVTSATYGASCHQPKGNVTKFLQDACNGQGKCDYTVKYQTIGDPAPGCSKDFSVEWTCSNGSGGSASAPAEAGFGSKVTLQCGQGSRG